MNPGGAIAGCVTESASGRLSEHRAQAREQKKTEKILRGLRQRAAQLTADAVWEFEQFCDELLNRSHDSTEPPDIVALRRKNLGKTRAQFVKQYRDREARTIEKLNAAANPEEMEEVLAMLERWLGNIRKLSREWAERTQTASTGTFTPLEDKETVEDADAH